MKDSALPSAPNIVAYDTANFLASLLNDANVLHFKPNEITQFLVDFLRNNIRHICTIPGKSAIHDPQQEADILRTIANTSKSDVNVLLNAMQPVTDTFYDKKTELAKIIMGLETQRNMAEMFRDIMRFWLNPLTEHYQFLPIERRKYFNPRVLPSTITFSADDVKISDHNYAIHLACQMFFIKVAEESFNSPISTELPINGNGAFFMLGDNNQLLSEGDLAFITTDGQTLEDNELKKELKKIALSSSYSFPHSFKSIIANREDAINLVDTNYENKKNNYFNLGLLDIPLLLPVITFTSWIKLTTNNPHVVAEPCTLAYTSFSALQTSAAPSATGHETAANTLHDADRFYTLLSTTRLTVGQYEELCLRRLVKKANQDVAQVSDEAYERFSQQVDEDFKKSEQFLLNLLSVLHFPIVEQRWQLARALIQQVIHQPLTEQEVAFQQEITTLFADQYQVNYAFIKENNLFPGILQQLVSIYAPEVSQEEQETLLAKQAAYHENAPLLNELYKTMPQLMAKHFLAIAQLVPYIQKKEPKEQWDIVKNQQNAVATCFNAINIPIDEELVTAIKNIALFVLGFKTEHYSFIKNNTDFVCQNTDFFRRHSAFILTHTDFVINNLEHVTKHIDVLEKTFMTVTQLSSSELFALIETKDVANLISNFAKIADIAAALNQSVCETIQDFAIACLLFSEKHFSFIKKNIDFVKDHFIFCQRNMDFVQRYFDIINKNMSHLHFIKENIGFFKQHADHALDYCEELLQITSVVEACNTEQLFTIVKNDISANRAFFITMSDNSDAVIDEQTHHFIQTRALLQLGFPRDTVELLNDKNLIAIAEKYHQLLIKHRDFINYILELIIHHPELSEEQLKDASTNIEAIIHVKQGLTHATEGEIFAIALDNSSSPHPEQYISNLNSITKSLTQDLALNELGILEHKDFINQHRETFLALLVPLEQRIGETGFLTTCVKDKITRLRGLSTAELMRLANDDIAFLDYKFNSALLDTTRNSLKMFAFNMLGLHLKQDDIFVQKYSDYVEQNLSHTKRHSQKLQDIFSLVVNTTSLDDLLYIVKEDPKNIADKYKISQEALNTETTKALKDKVSNRLGFGEKGATFIIENMASIQKHYDIIRNNIVIFQAHPTIVERWANELAPEWRAIIVLTAFDILQGFSVQEKIQLLTSNLSATESRLDISALDPITLQIIHEITLAMLPEDTEENKFIKVLLAHIKTSHNALSFLCDLFQEGFNDKFFKNACTMRLGLAFPNNPTQEFLTTIKEIAHQELTNRVVELEKYLEKKRRVEHYSDDKKCDKEYLSLYIYHKLQEILNLEDSNHQDVAANLEKTLTSVQEGILGVITNLLRNNNNDKITEAALNEAAIICCNKFIEYNRALGDLVIFLQNCPSLKNNDDIKTVILLAQNSLSADDFATSLVATTIHNLELTKLKSPHVAWEYLFNTLLSLKAKPSLSEQCQTEKDAIYTKMLDFSNNYMHLEKKRKNRSSGTASNRNSVLATHILHPDLSDSSNDSTTETGHTTIDWASLQATFNDLTPHDLQRIICANTKNLHTILQEYHVKGTYDNNSVKAIYDLANNILAVKLKTANNPFLTMYKRRKNHLNHHFYCSPLLLVEAQIEAQCLWQQIENIHYQKTLFASNFLTASDVLADHTKLKQLLSNMAQFVLLKKLIDQKTQLSLSPYQVLLLDRLEVNDYVMSVDTLCKHFQGIINNLDLNPILNGFFRAILSDTNRVVLLRAHAKQENKPARPTILSKLRTRKKQANALTEQENEHGLLPIKSKTAYLLQQAGKELSAYELGLEIPTVDKQSTSIPRALQKLSRRISQQLEKLEIQLHGHENGAKKSACSWWYNLRRTGKIASLFSKNFAMHVSRQSAWKQKQQALHVLKAAAEQGLLCLKNYENLDITDPLMLTDELRNILRLDQTQQFIDSDKFKEYLAKNSVHDSGFGFYSETQSIINDIKDYRRNSAKKITVSHTDKRPVRFKSVVIF